MTRANRNSSSRGSSEARTARRGQRAAHQPGDNFIVATHHAEFQTAKNRQKVRSKAMVWYRAQPPKRDSEDETAASPSPDPVLTPSPLASPDLDPVFVTETGRQGQSLSAVQLSRSISAYQVHGDDLQLDAPAVLFHGHVVGADSYLPTTGRVTSYEMTEHHQQLMLQSFASTFGPQHVYGDANNVLVALFTFDNPDVNADFLLREYFGLFGTDAMMQKWPRIMLSQYKLILSSTLLATLWNDVHNPSRSDRSWAMAVKEEVRGLVNQALHNCPSDDATLMAVLHLLVGEMWSSDEHESASREYERLIEDIITSPARIQPLRSNVQEVAAALCYHRAIAFEERPTGVFDDWSPQDLPKNLIAALPESPLFRHTAGLDSARRSPNCSGHTAKILMWIADLADHFIDSNTDATTPDIKVEDQGRGSQCLLNFHYDANRIRDGLASLDTAFKPNLETSNDWVYEACRIVALLYVNALVDRCSFSVAARSNRVVSALRSGFVTDVQADQLDSAMSPIEALVEVLKKTPTANIWGDMAGVFSWVCTVGAAAARTYTSPEDYCRPSLSKDQQYLVMHGTRAMTILVYEHPTPVIMALRKLLKIQSFLGSHDSRPDDS